MVPVLTKRSIPAAQFLLGTFLGFLIWAWPYPDEPWDGTIFAYTVPLFIAGLAGSFCRSSGFYWGAIGTFIGQVVFQIITLPLQQTAVILPPPVGILLFGTVQPLAGALLGAAIGLLIQRVWRKSQDSKS